MIITKQLPFTEKCLMEAFTRSKLKKFLIGDNKSQYKMEYIMDVLRQNKFIMQDTISCFKVILYFDIINKRRSSKSLLRHDMVKISDLEDDLETFLSLNISLFTQYLDSKRVAEALTLADEIRKHNYFTLKED